MSLAEQLVRDSDRAAEIRPQVWLLDWIAEGGLEGEVNPPKDEGGAEDYMRQDAQEE